MNKFLFKSTSDFGELSEYITEKSNVLQILKGAEFNLTDLGKEQNQYKYIFSIVRKNTKRTFDYFEGLGCEPLSNENLTEKIINCLWCLIMDYSLSEGLDYGEFRQNLGYENNVETKTIYRNILRNNKKLLDLFDINELEFLSYNINL